MEVKEEEENIVAMHVMGAQNVQKCHNLEYDQVYQIAGVKAQMQAGKLNFWIWKDVNARFRKLEESELESPVAEDKLRLSSLRTAKMKEDKSLSDMILYALAVHQKQKCTLEGGAIKELQEVEVID